MQPKIDIEKPVFLKYFALVAVTIFLLQLGYVISMWASLPNKIPAHYNVFGEVDAWGAKPMLLIFPLIGIIMWPILHALEKNPHLHNYVGLTEENRERLYKNSMMMMNVLKNEILIIFSLYNVMNVYISKNNLTVSPLGEWDFIIFIVVILGTLGFFVWRSFKLR